MFRSLVLILLVLCGHYTYGNNDSKAQKNEIDDSLFNSIGDRSSLEQKIQNDILDTSGKIKLENSINETSQAEEGRKASNELSNLKAEELDSKGKHSKEMHDMHKDGFFIDHNAPGLKPHKEDAIDLVNATEKFMDGLIDRLHENGIDCKELDATKNIDPAWQLEIEEKKDRDVIYDKVLCEHLRNQYSCKRTLTTYCKNLKADAASAFNVTKITGTSPPFSNSFGNGYWFIGWSGSSWGGSGTLHETNFDFTIDDVNAVHSFVLEEINFDDFALVKINNTTVYSGPFGGDKLDLVRGGWRNYVDIGTGQLHSAEQDTWWRRSPYVNMAPYLRSGTNTLSVRLVIGGNGGLNARIRYNIKACAPNDWVDKWEESCMLSN